MEVEVIYRKAKELMTEGVFSVSSESSIREAVSLFLEHHITALVVTGKKGNSIGVFSVSDLARYESQYAQKVSARGALFTAVEVEDYLGKIHQGVEHKSSGNEKVGNWMTAGLLTVGLEDDLHSCCQILSDNEVHRLFVEDEGEIVGVISNSDIIRSLAQEPPVCRLPPE